MLPKICCSSWLKLWRLAIAGVASSRSVISWENKIARLSSSAEPTSGVGEELLELILAFWGLVFATGTKAWSWELGTISSARLATIRSWACLISLTTLLARILGELSGLPIAVVATCMRVTQVGRLACFPKAVRPLAWSNAWRRLAALSGCLKSRRSSRSLLKTSGAKLGGKVLVGIAVVVPWANCSRWAGISPKMGVITAIRSLASASLRVKSGLCSRRSTWVCRACLSLAKLVFIYWSAGTGFSLRYLK